MDNEYEGDLWYQCHCASTSYFACKRPVSEARPLNPAEDRNQNRHDKHDKEERAFGSRL